MKNKNNLFLLDQKHKCLSNSCILELKACLINTTGEALIYL